MSTLDLRPRLAPGVTGRDLGDEYIFLDVAGDKLHILNGTAREILLLCNGQRRVIDVAQGLCQRYLVSPAMALSDAETVVRQLMALGLLVA